MENYFPVTHSTLAINALMTIERHFESGVRAETYHIGTESGTVGGVVGDGRPVQDVNRAQSRMSVRWERDRLQI